jgi:hypothetical protein
LATSPRKLAECTRKFPHMNIKKELFRERHMRKRWMLGKIFELKISCYLKRWFIGPHKALFEKRNKEGIIMIIDL